MIHPYCDEIVLPDVAKDRAIAAVVDVAGHRVDLDHQRVSALAEVSHDARQASEVVWLPPAQDFHRGIEEKEVARVLALPGVSQNASIRFPEVAIRLKPIGHHLAGGNQSGELDAGYVEIARQVKHEVSRFHVAPRPEHAIEDDEGPRVSECLRPTHRACPVSPASDAVMGVLARTINADLDRFES